VKQPNPFLEIAGFCGSGSGPSLIGVDRSREAVFPGLARFPGRAVCAADAVRVAIASIRKFGAAAALCEAPQQYPDREAGCPRCGSDEPACSVDGRTEERADRYRDQNEPPSPARKEAEDRRAQDEEHGPRQ
jgi:hypothetical protein